jgi:hypothetical protein
MNEGFKTIIVLAGNFREYNDFLEKSIWKDTKYNYEYVYAGKEEDIAGITADEVIKIGTWYTVKDIYRLEQFAMSRIR